jgi:hypothetical protein
MAVSLAIPLIQQPFTSSGNDVVLIVGKAIRERLFLSELKNSPLPLSEKPVSDVEIAENGVDKRIAVLPENNEYKETVAKREPSAIESVMKLLPAIYFAGMAVSQAGVLLSLFCVFRIVVGARKEKYGKRNVLVSRHRINSFTFAGWIVLSETDFRQHADEIITHENVHLRMAHSIDICLVNILTVLHWFNPLAWALRKELKSVHEYEADYHTLNQGIDAAKYQLLLIKKTVGSNRFMIASNFAQSNIKKRLIMMNRKFNSRTWWRMLIFIFMTALLTQAFARRENNAGQPSDLRDLNEPFLQTNDDDTTNLKSWLGIGITSVKSMEKGEERSNFLDKLIAVSYTGEEPNIAAVSHLWEATFYANTANPQDSLIRLPEEKDHVDEQFTKLQSSILRYNHQEMTLKEAMTQLLAFTKDHNLKAHLMYYCSPSPTFKGGISLCLPEIDRGQPQMYYFIDGKWWWSWNNNTALIQSIETLEPDAAVKRFGKKAGNGAIVMKTSIPKPPQSEDVVVRKFEKKTKEDTGSPAKGGVL